MKLFPKESLTLICSFVGIYMIILTLGVQLYWGNLSVYVNSYFRNMLGPDPSIKTPWVISLSNLGWIISTIGSGYIYEVIGERNTVILGCLFNDATIYLAYFFVQRSVTEVNLSMGLFNGLAPGLVITMGYENILSFDSRHTGILISTSTTALCVGSAILNEVITLYINPNNLTPDLYEDGEKYFTQPEVLDKVPSVFLLLGTISLCCQLIGLVLYRPQQRKVRQSDLANATETSELLLLTSQEESASESSHVSQEELQVDKLSLSASVENLSPKQILKCRNFYVLLLAFAFADYSYIVMSNYYKSYGQTWIWNDQFFAGLSTALLTAMVLSRPLWGDLTDRCGVKTTLVYLNCSTCVLCSFWYFTPMVSRWLYSVWTVLYASCNTGLYAIFPLATAKLFGQEQFSKNLGFVMSSGILLNVTAPSIMHSLLDAFGWFYLFFSVAVVNTVGLLLSAVILPRA